MSVTRPGASSPRRGYWKTESPNPGVRHGHHTSFREDSHRDRCWERDWARDRPADGPGRCANCGCDVNEAALAETRDLLAANGLSADLVVADVTKQPDVDHLIVEAGPDLSIVANVAGIMDHFCRSAIWTMRPGTTSWTSMSRVSCGFHAQRSQSQRPGRGRDRHGCVEGIVGSRRGWDCVRHVKACGHRTGEEHRLLLRAEGNPLQCCSAGSSRDGNRLNSRSPCAMGFDRAMLAMSTASSTIAEADQIATAISWLTSEEASNVNGALLTDDGGWASA